MQHNLAKRAHDHNFERDWIVRSLLDTDWYKLAMLQFIWKFFRGIRVRFKVINRTVAVRLADVVDEAELRAQLDHVRTLTFQRSQLVWLAGMTFYGQKHLFEPAFIEWLGGLRMPAYELSVQNGQYVLTFEGAWEEATLWEIYALAILSELRTRADLRKLDETDLIVLYAQATAKLWGMVTRLDGVPGLKVADFGTRRRHSFLWQEFVVTMLAAKLPNVFVGTSNAYLAFKHDLEAIGTNAHELPMVAAALARTGKLTRPGPHGGPPVPVSLKDSQYRVLELWEQAYGAAMRVMLPDTYGSTQFFRNAPAWLAKWTGVRLDSKQPYLGGDEALAFFQGHGEDVRQKLLIPSDGLDGDSMLGLHAYFGGRMGHGCSPADFRGAADFRDPAKWDPTPRCRDSMGIGTNLTNNFVGCSPQPEAEFRQISLVCKVDLVEGHPAVKLSDNYTKATGPADEIAYYRSVFGTEGVENAPVVV